MAKKIEFFEGKPVFVVTNQNGLEKAVAAYDGEVAPPYVVRVKGKSVKDNAFTDCRTIGIVLLDDNVETIGEWAFAYCSGLTNIHIPKSVTKIGYTAFKDCTGLTSIIIPDSVTEIGEYAFGNCM